MSLQFEPIDAQVAEFERELHVAASTIACTASDAGCTGNGPDIPPVGVLLPGQSLVDFWQVGFDHIGADLGSGDNVSKFSYYVTKAMGAFVPHALSFDQPPVTIILQQMLSVRRMSRGQLHDLLFQIQNLTQVLGSQDGGMIAATLIARIGQVLGEPEKFPPLLTDNELLGQYKRQKGLQTFFSVSGAALGDVASAGLAIDSGMGNSTIKKFLPESLARLGEKLSRFAGKGDSFKKTRFGNFAMLFGANMLAHGGDEADKLADQVRVEMIRRKLPDPKK